MTELIRPGDPGELYAARGDEIGIWRPLMQGDVFQNVHLPSLDEVPGLAMIFSHPCTMRDPEGAIEKRLVVGRVLEREKLPQWNGDYNWMPLPDLFGEGVGNQFHAADFRTITPIDSAGLDRNSRVACLSEFGVVSLLQQYVIHLTRVTVDPSDIHKMLSAPFAEAELQEEWVEAAFHASKSISDHLDFCAQSEKDFQALLNENARNLRNKIQNPLHLTKVRREVRKIIRERYGTGSA